MSSSTRYGELSNDQLRLVHASCRSFERALRNNDSPSIESQINSAPEEVRLPLFQDLLVAELEFRVTSENVPNIDEYLARFPDHHDDIRRVFQEADRMPDGPVRGSDAAIDDPHAATIGSVIGPYKLRELIGEGGMGLVYVAEQEVPVRRQVALKIIKPGMDTKEVLARFESERQALALMNHPHIAHVLDAGATHTGRPYFVMELIRGVPVTEYCNKHQLSTRTRLELFVQICQAVQHAHQKGIIHRDIKPSNILVILHGDVAVPKVIDFGVAKAVNQRLTERTFYTQMSQLVGTPMYMSPEQAERSALAVDTRTDIYSLGVVLYELLIGTTPFTKERLSKVGHEELRRIIGEEDPPRPSHRLSTLDAKSQSTISGQRSAGQLNLVHVIRGELDWIVMKAMEKDLTRRYETARDLAADIQHYLADEPVLACPPSAGYRLRKFARRNKIALAIAVFVIGGLLVSNILITRQKNAAEAQRKRADENFVRAREAVDRYFTLVSETTLLDSLGLQPLRRDLIENAVEFYQSWIDRGDAPPEVFIELANTRLRLGVIHINLKDGDSAVSEFEKAFELVDRVLARMPADSQDFRVLAGFYPGFRTTTNITSPESTDWQRYSAAFERGASLWRRLADAHPEVVEFHRDLLFLMSKGSDWYGIRGNAVDIEALRNLVQQHPDDKQLLAELAFVIHLKGKIKEDIDLMREGIVLLVEADLPVHRNSIARWQHNLAWRLLENGRSSEAVDEWRTSIAILQELAQEFPHIEEYEIRGREEREDLARALLESGRESEAEQLARSISLRTGNDYVARGNIYRQMQQVDKAMTDYTKALEFGLQGRVPNIGRVGEFLDEHKQHEKAIPFYNHGVRTNTGGHVSRIYASRGASWAHLKQYDKALADFTSAIEINAWDCEHHLSRMRPPTLAESPADFQTQFLKLADRAIEITEGNAESYITRSLVHFNLRQRDEAKDDLARGVKLDPKYTEINVRDYLQPLLRELQAEASAE